MTTPVSINVHMDGAASIRATSQHSNGVRWLNLEVEDVTVVLHLPQKPAWRRVVLRLLAEAIEQADSDAQLEIIDGNRVLARPGVPEVVEEHGLINGLYRLREGSVPPEVENAGEHQDVGRTINP